ncbi:MAG TPA: PocR ligand-binding domain-containing protein [Candidatus Bathyarchaeia archaeon]|nr:PocR ligand-binding domain-containing protein [Candidatus Bathyarchaeia archaeon]
MTDKQQDRLMQDVFSKERWIVPLERFVQVLRMNIFVVDSLGKPLIHPCSTARAEEYGCRILTQVLGLDLAKDENFLHQFSVYGDYLEYRTNLDLHVFAIPLRVSGRVVAYLIVGPAIMNRRLSDDEYQELAKKTSLDEGAVMDQVRGVRVVSYVAMNAVLDLLAAITREFIDIGIENRRLRRLRFQKNVLPRSVTRTAEGLYREIHVDELLISVLDVAMRLTNAESGSIMVFDKEEEEMIVRVSRGLNEKWVREARCRIGEGIAGIAAQENRCFVMRGQAGDHRVLPYLKRPEIKESMVMPISQRNRVFGVINLNSKGSDSRIEANAGYLVGLSRLLSAAVFSE